MKENVKDSVLERIKNIKNEVLSKIDDVKIIIINGRKITVERMDKESKNDIINWVFNVYETSNKGNIGCKIEFKDDTSIYLF